MNNLNPCVTEASAWTYYKFLRNSSVYGLREKTCLYDFVSSNMGNYESTVELDEDGVLSALRTQYTQNN